ncbi:MAG: hypothetical protein ABI402_14945 [Ferruginibacter sp.]
MKYCSILILLIICYSCKQTSNIEDPLVVSHAYCSCLENELTKAKDSSIDVNKCNFIFFTSRFIAIHLDSIKNSYNKSTLDSASIFFRTVGDIIDTMCINKIDPKKLKRIIKI